VAFDLLCVLDLLLRLVTRSVFSLDLASDVQGLGVGEFDLNILLLDPRELAVKFVSGLNLPDIELGIEGLGETASAAGIIALAVGVEVFKETEERVEGCSGGFTGDEGSWEGRHFGDAFVVEECWKNCSFDW